MVVLRALDQQSDKRAGQSNQRRPNRDAERLSPDRRSFVLSEIGQAARIGLTLPERGQHHSCLLARLQQVERGETDRNP